MENEFLKKAAFFVRRTMAERCAVVNAEKATYKISNPAALIRQFSQLKGLCALRSPPEWHLLKRAAAPTEASTLSTFVSWAQYWGLAPPQSV
jgi:hypothetical protein